MTQEQKAKAYDEALKRIKECVPDENGFITIYPQEIFPELKESGDEKIRKEILEYFCQFENGELRGVDISSWIAWLERQKPVEEINGDDYGIDGLYAAMDILNKTLGQVEGYQSDDGILAHKAAMTAVKKLYKQRPAEWSEEDEKILNEIISDFVGFRTYGTSSLEGHFTECIAWLKSLKDRVQSKQEWNDYYQVLAEANEEEEENLTQD